MEYIKDLTADLHILEMIAIILVFGSMFIWAGWSFLKFLLNMFGFSFKRQEPKKIEA